MLRGLLSLTAWQLCDVAPEGGRSVMAWRDLAADPSMWVMWVGAHLEVLCAPHGQVAHEHLAGARGGRGKNG
jgi:hypothetical protein